jgi:hypothetical protein
MILSQFNTDIRFVNRMKVGWVAGMIVIVGWHNLVDRVALVRFCCSYFVGCCLVLWHSRQQ